MLINGPSSSLSIQEQYEDDDRWLRTRRRHRVRSGLFTILTLMIAGAAWFAYPILKRHDSSLAQFLHTQQTMDKIDGSLREQQRKLAEWSHDREQLQDQVARLSHEIQSRIEALRKETGQAGENLVHTMEAQIERQIETIKGRLAAFKSSGDPDKSSDSHAAEAVRASPRGGKRTVERGSPADGEPKR